MQRTQVIPPHQSQDQNQDVVQAVCNLHLKYEEYFLFNYSLPIKTIYSYIVEKLETEFHQKSMRLKSGEFLQSPTEDNIATEIKTFCGQYRDKSGSVNLSDKNAEIAEEFVVIEESSDKILAELKDVSTEQAFERAIDSMDELLDAIYDYRFEKGYRAFAIGEHAELVQFFKDNRWFAQEVVASFPDDSAIQDAQTRSAKKFYEQYDFVTLNESLNDFYKKFFKAYIEAVGIDLSHSSSQKLKELFDDTFNNELDCSPVFLLTVLKDACQVLVKAIHSKIKEIDEREMQRKEKRAIREQHKQRDLESQTRRKEVSEEQVKQTVRETRKPPVMERERQKHVVTEQQPLAQAVAKLQRLQKTRVTEKPQPQTKDTTKQLPQTKVAAKQKAQTIAEQQSKNITAQNFRKILSAPSAEIKKLTESEEQKEKELARKAHEKQITLLHQQMRQGIEDELIKQKIKQKQEQQEREKNRMQKIVLENAEKKLKETLAEIERMVEGGEQKRKEQAVKEQRRQLEIEQQRRREAIEESRQQEIQEQKRKHEIEERRRREAIAAELKERAIAQQRRPHELQQNAKLFKPAEKQKPAVTEDEQVYVNDEEKQVIIVDDEKVVILNAELVLRKLGVFLAQEHHKRNVPDNMSPREFLKFLEDWVSKMEEKKNYLEEKIVLFKELQENEFFTHLFDQKTLIEDIQNVLRELQDYLKLYKDQFSGNDFTVAANSREEASRHRDNKR